MSKQVRVGVGVFVYKDGGFLMGKRLGSHGHETCSIPGGHLEFGESWEQCAKREVMEETGIEIYDVKFVALTNDIFANDGKHYETIWVRATWKSGEPTILEPEKWVDHGWYTFETLPTPLFEPCWTNLKLAKPEIFLG